MMMLFMDMKDGSAYCGATGLTSMTEVLNDELDFFELEKPASSAVTTTPNFNESGQVQLVDGSWVDPNTVRDPNQVKMKVQGSRFLAYDVDSMLVNKNEVKTIREMTSTEVERYEAARKSSMLSNSKLQVGGINPTEILGEHSE